MKRIHFFIAAVTIALGATNLNASAAVHSSGDVPTGHHASGEGEVSSILGSDDRGLDTSPGSH